MNIYRMVHQKGQKRTKRLKAHKTTPTKAKYTYWDVLRQADSSDEAGECPDGVTLRKSPSQRTGMDISGQVVTYRDKRGMLVIVGEDGQSLTRW